MTWHPDRRGFPTGVGLLTAGGVAGAAAAVAYGQATIAAPAGEAPTARTAIPAGPAAYVATVTFRTGPAARLIALTLDDGPTREWAPRVLAILRRHAPKGNVLPGRRAGAGRS